jgi:type IV pilus assembly protein PilM
MKFPGRNRISAGLDIGSGFVKLVVIDHARSEPEIVQVAISPLAPDAIVEGEVIDPKRVAETVRLLVESSGGRTKEVVAAVGGHDVIVKQISMDRMKEADAREVMRWEAERHVPFEMENVQLDFQILDPDVDEPLMQVLLVAAKRELIDNRMSLLLDAGLTVAAIDVDAFALHNAFEHNYPGSLEGFVALINVGNETTNVNLLDEGTPVLVRDLPFGSRRLRESLNNEPDHSAHASAAERSGLVEDRVDELAVGVERALAFLQSQNNAADRIGRVFVSGGGACIPGLVPALANRLSVRTEVANPLQRVAVRPEAMQAIAVDEFAPMLMLPVGLALRNNRGRSR